MTTLTLTSSHIDAPNLGGIRREDQEDITAFLDSLARRSPKTKSTYKEAVERLALYTASKGMPLLENLEREHLEAFFNSLKARGNAPATIRNRQASLRVFFNWTVEFDLRKTSPMARVKWEPVPDKLQPHYEPQDIMAVLEAIKGSDILALRDRAIVLVLYDTGLRAQELCDLRIGDLDREARIASVVSGKGGKGRRVRYDAAVASAIFKYIRKRGSLEPGAPLFAARGNKPLTFNGLRMLLERRFKAVGVAFRGAHGFRRSAGIAFLDAGGSSEDLKELMGWSSWAMLYRYTKATASERALRAHEAHSPVAAMMAGGRRA